MKREMKFFCAAITLFALVGCDQLTDEQVDTLLGEGDDQTLDVMQQGDEEEREFEYLDSPLIDNSEILDATEFENTEFDNKPQLDNKTYTLNDTTNIPVLNDTTNILDGSTNIINCTAAQENSIRNAVIYATNRVLDGGVEYGQCFDEAYLWENNGDDGQYIADLLTVSYNNFESITCDDLAPNYNAWAYVNTFGENLTIDTDFVNNNTVDRIASVIVHEILHNRGYYHNDTPHYSNSVSEQGESCILNWEPNPAVDTGYALYWNGNRAGYAPGWSLASAKNNCQWNKSTYPKKKVECYYNGKKIGYELYWDGVRVGYAPKWNYTSAKNNCQWNKDNYPSKKVECFHDGMPVGYSLYWNGQRVGFAPKWSYNSAKNNCQWNKNHAHSNVKVECMYRGRHVGYELFWNGKRVGFEPKWTLSRSQQNCTSNENSYSSTRVVDCTYNGIVIN